MWRLKPGRGRTIDTWREFDLGLTLYPSFVLAFLKRVKSGSHTWYVKIHGRARGSVISQRRPGTLSFSGMGEGEAVMLSGAWFNPLEESRRLPRSSLSRINKLLDLLPGLGLSIDPWDPVGLSYVAYLSQNTSFHGRVVPWFAEISKRAGGLDDRLGVVDVGVSSSYQVRMLSRVKNELVKRSRELRREDLWGSRASLLGVPGVGPKVAHAYLVFSGLGLELAPADRHLVRASQRHGITDSTTKPVKRLCISHSCDKCPLSRECIVSEMRRRYGGMAAWVQTAAYVVDTLGESRLKGSGGAWADPG